jgi:hypothetical protein
MKCREAVFAGGSVVKTRFTHLTPFACLPLIEADLPEAVASLDSDRTALVSFIENGDARYIVVVNTEWRETVTVSADFRQEVAMIDRSGKTYSVNPGSHSFTVDGGDMLVIKWR